MAFCLGSRPSGPAMCLQEEGAVGGGTGHGAGVVEGYLDGEDPGIGHEAVGGLEAVDATPAAGDADGATLIAAYGHVDGTRAHKGGAAAG